MAIRLRRSPFMADYFNSQHAEEEEIQAVLREMGNKA
jgi:hypothetical protein